MDSSPVSDPTFPSDPSFTCFPTEVAEDAVVYEIRVLDDNLSETALREKLRTIQSAATQLIRRFLKGYIWQRDPFRLEIRKEKGRSYLAGRTDYGDAVEDEWLIVYLLRDLSRQFSAAWVRVRDGDGEFLLAEAANVLPKWLTPDMAGNRVWINQGELLIIPQTLPGPGIKGMEDSKRKMKEEPKFISLPQALSALQGLREALVHSPLIEEEAFFRLRNYPAQIEKNLHHALITVPRRVAFILHHLPASISPAVEAFYLRDPIALRPLHEGGMENLLFPPEDFVTSRIKFTRVGFAQVRSQRFVPIGSWAKAVDSRGGGIDDKARERAEMGMKLACGFEMLVGDPQNGDRQIVREVKILLEDLRQGDEKLPTDDEITGWGTSEDDDKWMDINFQDFEAELRGRKGASDSNGKTRDGTGFGDAAAQENLQKLVSRFEEFLNADEMADEDDDESSESDEESDDAEDKGASFTEDEFTALMREMMGMPPETMQELMGSHAPVAEGLAEQQHPDLTDIEAYRDRLTKLFESLDVNSETKSGDKLPANATTNGANKGSSASKQLPAEVLDGEEEQVKQISALMEAELRKAGALDLPDPAMIRHRKIKESAEWEQEQSEESDDEELLDEEYNLVSNLLQSFKGQAGAAGPSGNLMGMMGLQMPRDEESEDGARMAKQD